MYSYEVAAQRFLDDVKAGGKYPPIQEGEAGQMAEISGNEVRFYMGTYVPQNPMIVRRFTCDATVASVVEAMKSRGIQFSMAGR